MLGELQLKSGLVLCSVFLQQEEKALKALKEKAKTGSVGGAGLKKSGGKK